jgi:hypothetical protein
MEVLIWNFIRGKILPSVFIRASKKSNFFFNRKTFYSIAARFTFAGF